MERWMLILLMHFNSIQTIFVINKFSYNFNRDYNFKYFSVIHCTQIQQNKKKEKETKKKKQRKKGK